MDTAQTAGAAGTTLSVAAIAMGQFWLVGSITLGVFVTAVAIRIFFRRGRTPQDR